MAEQDEKIPASRGNSGAETQDLEAIYEQLRQQLRRGSANGDSGGDSLAHVRELAERFWPVTAERPAGSGAKGLAKRLLRKLMRWYVEPLAADQRVFNDATLKLIDALVERTEQAAGARERTERLLGELEERLTRSERRDRADRAPSTVAAQPGASALPDYFAFESRMRGSVETVRARQRRYLEDLQGQGPVLDVGCGRGELLGLLAAAEIEARGIDADGDMVAYAAGEGLDVHQADAVTYLGGLADGELGAIFMAQVVEHLPPPTLVGVLSLAAEKLRPGGLLIAETINPLSPLALRNYFADLTHAQPLVPETLELLVRQAGFAEVETRFLNEPADRLTEPDDPLIAANVRRLNELLFGPLDYAVLARTSTR